ncbi:MAG: hypothetical protein A2Y34_09610 [Spirochaetes bacterium GWC1_27_15]|nr:MAG: hypothetical protein A2Z98_06680 [Spirochaetes bacterium GWB1_27_13]OHD26198.1 MAG: hypothetical protein A2Y34_09610 [Spirochaetes bacterium GWC1_27_15]
MKKDFDGNFEIAKKEEYPENCKLEIKLDRLKEILLWNEEKNNPPVSYSILESDYFGEVLENDCIFHANIKVEVYSNKWTLINILNSDTVVKSSTCKNGGSFGYSQKGYCFIAEAKGIYEIELQFYISFSSKERKNGVRLFSCGSGKLYFKIPKINLRCTILPSSGLHIKEDDNITEIFSYIGAGEVNIGWSLKIEEEPKEEIKPIVNGEVQTGVIIGESLIKCRSDIYYSIYQAGVISFNVKINDAKIISVIGEGIRTYDVKPNENHSIIRIILDYEATSYFNASINYEKKLETPSIVTEIPTIELQGVDRETGFISISNKTNIEITTEEQENLSAIDSKELPDSLKSSFDLVPVFSFKYLKSPFRLKLDIKRHNELPVLICIADFGIFTTVVTEEGKIITVMELSIRNNSKQFLNINLPKNAICLSSFVKNEAVKPAINEKNEVMMPLPKVSEENSSFRVELVWIVEKDKFDRGGTVEVSVGKLDIPVSKFGFILYLPFDYKYRNFRGNIKSVQKLSFLMPNIPAMKPTAYKEINDMLVTQTNMDIMAEQAVMPKMELAKTKARQIGFGKAEMSKGLLPVKIEIPKSGEQFNFEKTFVQNEEIKLKIQYNKKFKLFKKGIDVKDDV